MLFLLHTTILILSSKLNVLMQAEVICILFQGIRDAEMTCFITNHTRNVKKVNAHQSIIR